VINLPPQLNSVSALPCKTDKQKLRTRSTFTKSGMVSVAASKMGVAVFFFVEPEVKVNGKYYRDVLL